MGSRKLRRSFGLVVQNCAKIDEIKRGTEATSVEVHLARGLPFGMAPGWSCPEPVSDRTCFLTSPIGLRRELTTSQSEEIQRRVPAFMSSQTAILMIITLRGA